MTTIEMPQTPVSPEPESPQPRHRGRKILLWVLLLAVLAVFGAVGFLLWTDSKIDRIPDEELQSLQPVGSGTRNILIVGTDSREGLPDDFEGSFGDFSGSRTDVIMVAHVENGVGQLLSIPRDLKVEIPGQGTNKVNAAFVFGGPDLLVQTVQQNLGIEVNHYMEIDFVGFANVVDAMGGVTLTFDNPARDLKSGLSVDAGTHTLNGEQALAYARSRSYQELVNGEWVSVDGSDIGRTGRQQELLLTMFTQAASPGNAFNLPGFASTFADQIRADEGLSVSAFVDIGTQLLRMGSDSIETRTLPVAISNEGGVSYVVEVEPDATNVINAFNAATPFPQPS
jgi:LCP family protein required for cell wall assembly